MKVCTCAKTSFPNSFSQCEFFFTSSIMFALSLLFAFNFVQFSSCFFGSNGFLFGFQKVCFCRCGIAQKNIFDTARSSRLLGGESAAPHQFPWLAVVNIGLDTSGGSLISDRHVLTAASSLYGISNSGVTVTLGAHDRCANASDPALTIGVDSVILHPAYSPTNMDNDIALLRLKHTVPFSNFISPICMPFVGSEEITQVAWTVSWSNDILSTCTPRFASLPIVDRGTCAKVTMESRLITHDRGCLGPIGAKSIVCKTDKGAPVMTRWRPASRFRLVGVMSPASSCDERHPPRYTRVIDHLVWIYPHIRADCQCF